jgi:hypothetical protein
MNWRLVGLLGLFGPLMGALIVLGAFPRGVDRFAWVAVVGVCAVVVGRRERARARALAHGAVLGFWNGASATLLQALLLERWVANNPWVNEAFANQPPGFDLEFFVFMLVPFIGVAGGALTALLAVLAARVFTASGGGSARGGETAP